MNLIPCPACSRELSPAAKSCPHCGHVFPRRKLSPGRRVGLIAFTAFFLFLWWSMAIHHHKEDLRKRERASQQQFEDLQAMVRRGNY